MPRLPKGGDDHSAPRLGTPFRFRSDVASRPGSAISASTSASGSLALMEELAEVLATASPQTSKLDRKSAHLSSLPANNGNAMATCAICGKLNCQADHLAQIRSLAGCPTRLFFGELKVSLFR